MSIIFQNAFIFFCVKGIGVFSVSILRLNMANKKTPKNALKYTCALCNFTCSKLSEYNRHIITRKHKLLINTNDLTPKNAATEFFCECGKKYKHQSSLCKHKQKCNLIKNNKKESKDNHNETKTDKDLIMLLVKENSDLKNMVMETQNQIMEVIKNGTNNTTNNNNFNLNLFLNETCKDAMNIMDFVESLKLQLSDLENMEEIGYVNGMSNIIIKNLKDMEVTVRPIHCTDAKRETLYIKDEDKWDKESYGNPKIKKAIKHIARKNAIQLKNYKEKYPDCIKSESKYSDTYNKLVVEAMGGKGENVSIKEDKIIKKVMKEIIVDK